MKEQKTPARGNVLARALMLYGLYTILSNACFLVGYYLLPEGFMRGGPQMTPGEIASRPEPFWAEFALTLLFNLGIVAALGVVLNFNLVKGFPMGYLILISNGITGGLILGTNSFVTSDLSDYDARARGWPSGSPSAARRRSASSSSSPPPSLSASTSTRVGGGGAASTNRPRR